jgi:hypothetical protein
MFSIVFIRFFSQIFLVKNLSIILFSERHWSMRTFAWLCCGLLMLTGCYGPSRPSRVNPPSINAANAGKKAMEMYDTNKDGKVSGSEFDKCPSLKAVGTEVTADAIQKKIEHWQELRTGLTHFVCEFRHRGKPLADAEVKFIPEKFLGDDIKVATGKTDEMGRVLPVIGTEPSKRGIALGWYRVVVTKPGVNIPPKYSGETETVLGALVENSQQPTVVFDLNY